jgi:hypothetical protein
MEIEALIISASVTMLSFGLLLVSLVSYCKHRNLKLLFISGVFIILLIKGMVLSVRLFFLDISEIELLLFGTYAGIFDLFVLILLFIATFKR